MQVVGEQPGATLSFETFPFLMGFPGGSDSKASANNMGDLGFIPGSGRSSGKGNGNPLQNYCRKIPWMEEPGRIQSMGLQRVRHD